MRRSSSPEWASSHPSATIRRKSWRACARPSPASRAPRILSATASAVSARHADARSRRIGGPPRHALPRAKAPPGITSPWRQAIRDSGVEEKDISNPRTGIVMGSGGPSTSTIVEAPTSRAKMVRRSGSDLLPCEIHVVDRVGDARHLVQDQGSQLFDLVACATSNHCIGNGAELIQWGKQDMVFAGGSEELHWTMSNLFRRHGRDVVQI